MKKLLCLLVLLVPSIAAAQPGYRGGGGGYYQDAGGPWAFHNGLTFEGNLGLGGMWSRVDGAGGTSTSDTVASVGADFSVGGFLSPQVALMLRVASVSYTEPTDQQGVDVTTSAVFVGPAIQYWVNPNFWIGGGIGYAIAHQSVADNYTGVVYDSTNDPQGLGLDLRAGYTFWRSFRNSLNVSAEYTPGFYGKDNAGYSYQLNGFQIAFGYQFL